MVYIIVIVLLALLGLYAFFNSGMGRIFMLVCCGGVVALVVVGILSENGMRRR